MKLRPVLTALALSTTLAASAAGLISGEEVFAAVRDTCALPQALPAGPTFVTVAFGDPGSDEINGSAELVNSLTGQIVSTDTIANYEGTYGFWVFPEPGSYPAMLRLRGTIGQVDSPVSVLAIPTDVVVDVKSPEPGVLYAEVPVAASQTTAGLKIGSGVESIAPNRIEPFGLGQRFVWTGLDATADLSVKVANPPRFWPSGSASSMTEPRAREWPVSNTRRARADGRVWPSVRVEKSPSVAFMKLPPNPGVLRVRI